MGEACGNLVIPIGYKDIKAVLGYKKCVIGIRLAKSLGKSPMVGKV